MVALMAGLCACSCSFIGVTQPRWPLTSAGSAPSPSFMSSRSSAAAARPKLQSIKDGGLRVRAATWSTREFDSWMDLLGISRCVRVDNIDGCGRGLRSTRDLLPDEVVLKVPSELVLSDLTVLHHSNYEEMQEGMSWSSRLALGLLNEKSRGDRSVHRDYIGMLPAPPRVLSRWKEDELVELQNRTLEGETDMIYFWRHENWEDTVTSAETVLTGSEFDTFRKRISQQDFLDAHDLVCSRAIKLETARGVERFLVPVFDLANHSPRGGRYAMDEDGNVCLITGIEVTRGAEVRGRRYRCMLAR